jgi:hypothetical protein
MSSSRAIAAFIALSALSFSRVPPLQGTELSDGLAERIDTYWAARSAFDLSTTWNLEFEMHSGAGNPLDYYRRHQRAPRVIDYELGEVVVDGDVATVPLTATIALPVADLGMTKQQPFTDRWIFEDGTWWHDNAERAQGEP